MGTLEELASIRERYDKVMEGIELLEKCDIIKQYHSLVEEGEILKAEIDVTEREEKKKKKIREYTGCSHLRVCTRIVTDGYNVVRSYGCVKCGVNTVALTTKGDSAELDAMRAYLGSLPGRHLNGINTGEDCDLSLAMVLYQRIKRDHPEADDMAIREYFKNALRIIRDKNMTRKQEDDKIKRLDLNPGFCNWYKESVMHCK